MDSPIDVISYKFVTDFRFSVKIYRQPPSIKEESRLVIMVIGKRKESK